MAGGVGRNLRQLDARSARLLLRGGDQEIFSARRIAFGFGFRRGIPNKLLSVAGKYAAPGSDNEGKRNQGCGYCWVSERARGSRSHLQTFAERLCRIAERSRSVLSRLSVAHRTA